MEEFVSAEKRPGGEEDACEGGAAERLAHAEKRPERGKSSGEGGAMEQVTRFFDAKNRFALLAFSIACEVFGATMMKLADGFTVPTYSVLTALAYIVSLGVFTFALKRIPLGLAYGIWGGTGTAATAVIGVVFWNEPFGWTTCLGIALVAGGIVLLNKGDEETQTKREAKQAA